MFNLPRLLHTRVARLLSNVSIGTRLLALMGLAAGLAIVLAASGTFGLALSKESLRYVYENRMQPVRQLGEISTRMLENRLLLHYALNEATFDTGHQTPQLGRERTAQAAIAIERNIASIDTLWKQYASAPLPPQERALAERFAQRRAVYLREGLRPAVTALQLGDYNLTRHLATRVQALHERTAPELLALTQLQFDAAREAYAEGIERFERARLVALAAVGLAIVLMSWLGAILIASIVRPLGAVIATFRHISEGRYDTPIAIEGRDEISKVMLALRDMQSKLGVNEEAIHRLAFYDPLTMLPNRRLLQDRLQQALGASARSRLFGAVVMLDLDHFKTLNDTRGHDVGDRLLIEVAQRLRACVRAADTVARLGGDEFIILLVDLHQDEVQAALLADAVGKKILAAINQPFLLSGKVHHTTASIGICLFIDQINSPEDLLMRADAAMYQAKTNGRNTLCAYDPQIQAALETRIALESDLRLAVAAGQLRLYYQIQVDKRHGVLGAEALLRWERPLQGLLSPDRFIPVAEETGLILEIGEWVLETACEQLRRWSMHPHTSGYILSVNVSARQFRQPDFVAVVRRIVAGSGIDPSRLKLELTESMVMHNLDDAVAKMSALTEEGICFSMDDFGTGYSSLSHLAHLPIQQLKIDRSFIRNLMCEGNHAVIVETIIGMAQTLGMDVIAEGVETKEQLAFLICTGCHSYQGYLFGQPVPLHEFEELARKTAPARIINPLETP